MTGHKRALGWGTFFALVFTYGIWILAIPFYPKRCIICGREPSWNEFSLRFTSLRVSIIIAMVFLALLASIFDSIHWKHQGNNPAKYVSQSPGKEFTTDIIMANEEMRHFVLSRLRDGKANDSIRLIKGKIYNAEDLGNHKYFIDGNIVVRNSDGSKSKHHYKGVVQYHGKGNWQLIYLYTQEKKSDLNIWPMSNKDSKQNEKVVTFAQNSTLMEQLSIPQKKELIVFGINAMGKNVEPNDIKTMLSDSEIENLVATGLNLNALLCAQITEIRSLKLKSKYEVTCIAYRRGTAQRTYIIDSLKGVAFLP